MLSWVTLFWTFLSKWFYRSLFIGHSCLIGFIGHHWEISKTGKMERTVLYTNTYLWIFIILPYFCYCFGNICLFLLNVFEALEAECSWFPLQFSMLLSVVTKAVLCDIKTLLCIFLCSKLHRVWKRNRRSYHLKLHFQMSV